MNRLATLFCLILLCTSFRQSSQLLFDEEEFRSLKNSDFSKGEELTYEASYGFFTAGKAVIHLDNAVHSLNNRPCYKVTVEGKSIGTFGMVMNIKDTWVSYIDTASIMPHKFYRDITEGPVASSPYRLKETTWFDHKKQTAKVEQTKNGKYSLESFTIPRYAQDIISGYYYLRTIEFDRLREGDHISMPAFFEDKVYDFKVKYLGKDQVRSNFGKIDCYVMSPVMPENSLFDGEHSIKFWVTNDENRVPLKIEAKMFVGAVKVDLVQYKGLKSDIKRSKKKK
ncbi:DUF3108 domain-containing protein [Rapidithrix thailandica]|uniref:DUF3108 domain-containing protein n=1 Tax=Rapidithrix thailandica TaxID=413964 RepID=A0AAW9SJ67_9BACT